MKKRTVFFHPVFIFILAQLAWLSLLGLWIYWYFSNYIILKQVGDNLSPKLISKSTNIVALVWGLILLVFLLAGMYFIFIFLTRQMHLTRLYDKFIANITHELKSPLASILLYLETLSVRKVSRDQQKTFISLMIKDVNRLQNLINSLLRLSGIEKQRMFVHFQVYRMEEMVKSLIREAIDLFKVPADAIIIEGKASCSCVIDRDALKIVIDNLIDNAKKFTSGPLRLNIDMTCSSKRFILKIKDQGIGISSHNQKMIFNKFFRVGKSQIPDIRGTGLGLFIVREIIRSHGGNISVFSAGENKGTTFTLELPIYRASKKRFLSHLLKISQKMEKADNAGKE